MDPFDLMDTALKTDYPNIPPLVRKMYTPMLVSRAVRFYIENTLDSTVVEEDLLEEDRKYPNLSYSQEHERNYYKSVKNTYNKLYGNRNSQSGTPTG